MLKKKSFFVFLCIVIAVFFFYIIKTILFSFNEWISCSGDKPKKVDCIVTFAGEAAREVYAKSLIDSGYSKKWVASKWESDILKEIEFEYKSTVLEFMGTSENTHDEVDSLLKWLDNNKSIKNVALVSGFYHMRRIKLLVEKKKLNGSCNFFYWPVPSVNYGFSKKDIDFWWKNKHLRNLYAFELQKIAYYFIKY